MNWMDMAKGMGGRIGGLAGLGGIQPQQPQPLLRGGVPNTATLMNTPQMGLRPNGTPNTAALVPLPNRMPGPTLQQSLGAAGSKIGEMAQQQEMPGASGMSMQGSQIERPRPQDVQALIQMILQARQGGTPMSIMGGPGMPGRG